MPPGGDGVDLTAFDPERYGVDERRRLRRALGLDPERPVALMATRLLWSKGVGEYCAAAALLGAAGQFALAGGPDPGSPDRIEEPELAALLRPGHVKYLGPRDDMPALLAAADLVVLPTYYYEGVPRILLEAAAMGLPAVATRLPGIERAIQENRTGLLVDADDPAQLIGAVGRLLSDPKLRREYGQAGRQYVQAGFSQDAVAELYIERYRDALGASPGRR